MAFLNFGVANGLAYRHNFNADRAALLQEEAMINNQRAINDAKAEKIGSQMKVGVGYTRYQQREIDKIANDMTIGIGELSAKNGGNLFANPLVYSEFQRMANRMSNNEHTIKADATKLQFDKFTTFLAEKPNRRNNPKIQRELEYWKEFDETGEYGLIDPETGQKTGEVMRDFVFVNPLNDLDLNKINIEHMKNVKGDKTFEGDTDSGGYYTRYQYASDDVLRKEAASILGNEDVKDKAEDEFMSNESMYKFYRGNMNEWYAQQKLKGLAISEGESKFDTRRTPTKTTTTKTPEPEVRQQLQDAAAVALANRKEANEAGTEATPAPMSSTATAAIVDVNGQTTNEAGVFTTTSDVIINGKKVTLANDKFSPNPGIKVDANDKTYVDGLVWVDLDRAQSLVEDTLWIHGNVDRNLITFKDYKADIPKQSDANKTFAITRNDLEEYGAKLPEVGVNPIQITPEGLKKGFVAKNEIRLGTGNAEPVHMIGIPFKKYFNPEDEFLNTQVNDIQGAPKTKGNQNYYETGKYKFTMTYDGANWGRNAETDEWVEIE